MASFCSRDRDVRLPFFSQTSWSFDRKVRNQQNLVCYINILQFGPWKFSLLLQTHCISNEIDKHPGICQHINEMTTVKLCIVHSPLLTGPSVSRTSMSVISSNVMVAVCGVPPARTCFTAGLSPVRRGPLWRKACPIIRPAIMYMSFCTNTLLLEGTRWPDCPSNSMVPHEFPKENENQTECQCLLILLNIIGSIQKGKKIIMCKKKWSPARPYWFCFWLLWHIDNMGERHYISNEQIWLMQYTLNPAITEPWNPCKIPRNANLSREPRTYQHRS
jgi:hypothetical protein